MKQILPILVLVIILYFAIENREKFPFLEDILCKFGMKRKSNDAIVCPENPISTQPGILAPEPGQLPNSKVTFKNEHAENYQLTTRVWRGNRTGNPYNYKLPYALRLNNRSEIIVNYPGTVDNKDIMTLTELKLDLVSMMSPLCIRPNGKKFDALDYSVWYRNFTPNTGPIAIDFDETPITQHYIPPIVSMGTYRYSLIQPDPSHRFDYFYYLNWLGGYLLRDTYNNIIYPSQPYTQEAVNNLITVDIGNIIRYIRICTYALNYCNYYLDQLQHNNYNLSSMPYSFGTIAINPKQLIYFNKANPNVCGRPLPLGPWLTFGWVIVILYNFMLLFPNDSNNLYWFIQSGNFTFTYNNSTMSMSQFDYNQLTNPISINGMYNRPTILQQSKDTIEKINALSTRYYGINSNQLIWSLFPLLDSYVGLYSDRLLLNDYYLRQVAA